MNNIRSPQEKLRARHLTGAQIARLEDAWKTRPDAKVDDLSAPDAAEEPDPVALRYEVRPVGFLQVAPRSPLPLIHMLQCRGRQAPLRGQRAFGATCQRT